MSEQNNIVENAVETVTDAAVSVLKQGNSALQLAKDKIKALGLVIEDKKPQAIVTIIEEIADVDTDQTYFIARTLSEQEAFDDLVVEKISGIAVGDDYKEITAAFDSIRADAKEAAENAASGAEKSFWGKVTSMFKDATEGDISDRFAKIEERFEGVTTALSKQLAGEKEILEAYKLFRVALGQSLVAALNVKAKLEVILVDLKAKAAAAQKAVEDAQTSSDEAQKVSLAMARDSANDLVSKAENRFDVGKDLADQLMIAYNVTEVTMKKLEETSKLKDRIFKRAVTFFSTNRSTLAALKANYNATIGLAEGTNALDAMKDGINKSLDDLASVSNKVNEHAIRSGYGATISADSVKNLVDSLVKFTEESQPLIEEMRDEATKNAESIRASVEDGKRRYSAIVNKISA